MTVGAGSRRERPQPFADDWGAKGTPRPPTTIANPLGAAGRAERPTLARASVGARYRRYEVEELAAAPSVDGRGSMDLSPSGDEVAFAWDRSGTFEIYSAPLVGDRIIQLTSAGAASRSPRWSPDGRWLAFLRSEGDVPTALWLVDRDGERERRLTDATGYRDHAWSPDGARIAVADGAGDIRVLDPESGRNERIASGSFPRWSPDGRSIVFTARGAAAGDLGIVPGGGGAARALDTREGKSGSSIDARWSPDGATIAFTTTVRGHPEVAFARVRDGSVVRVERVGATPFADSDPEWRPDGRGVIYRRRAEGSVALRRVFTISHDDDGVADLPGVHSAQCVASDSDTVVSVLSQATRPADVVVRAGGAISIARVTASLPASIDPLALVEPVAIPIEGGIALAYLPHAEAGGPRSLVLYARPAEREWDPVAQLLANAGHVVVATDAEGADPAAFALRFGEAGIATRGATRVEARPALAYADRATRVRALDAMVSGLAGTTSGG
ncbi:MAG: PD40 domain-containing protein [Chloroflexota bacterium]|nr:PD40 domain-containing protein [Chloroflexota bacterium]MDE3193247.1 PD40 domain-containing protein [Chloroflexota bacterium]